MEQETPRDNLHFHDKCGLDYRSAGMQPFESDSDSSSDYERNMNVVKVRHLSDKDSVASERLNPSGPQGNTEEEKQSMQPEASLTLNQVDSSPAAESNLTMSNVATTPNNLIVQ